MGVYSVAESLPMRVIALDSFVNLGLVAATLAGASSLRGAGEKGGR